MKTMIFGKDLKGMDDYFQQSDLDTMDVFYCDSREDAFLSRDRNIYKGIPCRVIELSGDNVFITEPPTICTKK